MSKMYIAVLDEFPDFMTPTLVGHAVLGYHIDMTESGYSDEFPEIYDDWLRNSFKKVVVRVNQKEFDKIDESVPHTRKYRENKTLGGKDSCIVTVVSDDMPNVLKYAKLWKPKVN